MSDLKKLNNNSELLFVTGVARSGTTLLSRCLNQHPDILCFADPLNELFRSFHHFVYFKLHGTIKKPTYPMDNFFFSGSKEVQQFIEKTDLKHEIPEHMRKGLLERISKRGGHYCPEMKNEVLECKSKTFDQLILEVIEILVHNSDSSDTRFIGFKDAWCEQLIPALSRTFTKMKFVTIIRDPRAVVSSNYFSGSLYPLLFNIRDWRKSVYWSWKCAEADSQTAGRFLSVKYENLITAPQDSLQRITKLLNIEYAEEMTENSIKPNTSYENDQSMPGMNQAFKEKWKDSLPTGKQVYVEQYCRPEMAKLGYMLPERSLKERVRGICFGELKYEEIAPWCREILPSAFFYPILWKTKNWFLESFRLFLLKIKAFPGKVINRFFYDKSYFKWLQQQTNGESLCN